MTTALPLLHGFASPHAVFAWRRGRPIAVDAFLADVDALARRLPAGAHVLNVCTDRYRFAVGLGAAIVRGQVSLLPPSTHAATVRQLSARFPDAYCLAESVQADIDLPQTILDDADGTRTDGGDVPSIDGDQTIAYVFTSGSTGVPTLHRKRWASLVVNVRSEAERLGCTPRTAIVATVPPQHMYGFESSLLMAWQAGAALVAERPFYPADIAVTLAGVNGERMLVTTPLHLRTLLDTDLDLPRIDTIVCATAPLSADLAARAEHRTTAPVLEIYGCTETGQLASRRPTVDPWWRPFGDVTLRIEGDGEGGTAIASGGHIDEPTALGDVIEPAADFATTRRFALAGRAADLVNIAGKRTSLGHLNLQLNAIDGVIDGVFVMRDEDDVDGVTRLAALVVAPTLDAAHVLAGLRSRIDPVFLPRPLYRVEHLPRNATGKLTHAAVHELVARLRARPSATPDIGGSA